MSAWIVSSKAETRANMARWHGWYIAAKQSIDPANVGISISGTTLPRLTDFVVVSDEWDFDFFYAMREFKPSRIATHTDAWKVVSLKAFGVFVSPNSVFRTRNLKLFNGTYFPREMASFVNQDEFGQNIEGYLRKVGVLKKSCEVLELRDLGGWDSIGTLIAKIEVSLKPESETEDPCPTIMVEGIPLIQPISINIDDYKAMLRSRLSLLSEFCIQNSIVDITGGTMVRQRGIRRPDRHPEDRAFYDELARLCALVDSRLLAIAESIRIKSDFGLLSDMIDLSFAEDLDLTMAPHPRIENFLELSGPLPAWREIRRAFRCCHGGKDFLQARLQAASSTIAAFAADKYSYWLREFGSQAKLLFLG